MLNLRCLPQGDKWLLVNQIISFTKGEELFYNKPLMVFDSYQQSVRVAQAMYKKQKLNKL